jgi:hypothetical protein
MKPTTLNDLLFAYSEQMLKAWEEEEDDHSRYWNDENIDEYEDALYGVV